MQNSSAENERAYAIVAQAIEYIRVNARQQPSLSDIAAVVSLSESHLQRIFSRWAGISPKRFLQYLTKEYAKQALKDSKNVLTTAMDAGLSGSSRLHDLMISCEAMTPGEIGAQGKGVTVTYGFAGTPFGAALIGWTPRGICNLMFCDEGVEDALSKLAADWPCANLVHDNKAAIEFSDRIFSSVPEPGRLHLLLRGTNFQIKVWEALLKIGSSQLASYSTVAHMAGCPKAQRAVGTANAANKIAFLIPCHRVIRESGEVGLYRWGGDRKLAMLAWEAAKKEGLEQ